jgi:hypothetical protein
VEKGSSSDSQAASKGLRRGFEASKQNQDQSTETGAEKSSAADAARSRPSGEHPENNYSVIEKLAHLSIDVLGTSSYSDLLDDTKQRCAEHHIASTPELVSAAVQSAVHQRGARV